MKVGDFTVDTADVKACPHGYVFLSACKECPGWISVKDKLPSHHQLVLAIPKNVACPVVLKFEAGAGSGNGYLFMLPDLTGQVLNISHWMPLPELPNNE